MKQQALKIVKASRPNALVVILTIWGVWGLSLSFSTPAPFPSPGKGAGAAIESCQLPAPAEFMAQSDGNSSITLSWSPSLGASAYQLLVYNEYTREIVCNRTELGTSAVLYNLQSGVSYRCVVASRCSNNSTSSFIITIDVTI